MSSSTIPATATVTFIAREQLLPSALTFVWTLSSASVGASPIISPQMRPLIFFALSRQKSE